MAARVRRPASIALALALLLTAGSGCVLQYGQPGPQVVRTPSPHARGHGPPAHAPAHGQRRVHRHDRVELVYDARLDLYVVDGRADVYWDGQRYLRPADGSWQASLRIDGVWVGVAHDEVPPRLVFWHERGYGGPAQPLPASPAP